VSLARTNYGRSCIGNRGKRVHGLGILLPSCSTLCESGRGFEREHEQSSGEDLVAAVTDVIAYIAVRVPTMAETAPDSFAEFSRVTVQ
jgi:hypothetical protein